MISFHAEQELALVAREEYVDRLDGLGPEFECSRCGRPLSDAELLHGDLCDRCRGRRLSLVGAECVPLSLRRRYRGEHSLGRAA